MKGINPEQLQIKVNSELQNLYQWCCVSKLSIIHTKTNTTIISPKQTKESISHLYLTSNGSAVNC